MASLNNLGNVMAKCPGCSGSTSTFVWKGSGGNALSRTYFSKNVHQFFICNGCGMGGIGVVALPPSYTYESCSSGLRQLVDFYPEVSERLSLPSAVPDGIREEFREAEKCMDAGCLRAAAGLFRSVLDKTMKANGYHTAKENNLKKQIDAAADDGVITQARKKLAHDNIRVLGNDVLHDDWEPIPQDDVEASRKYCQRILEDLYDDRQSVLDSLRAKGRQPEEDRSAST
jgi:Domain of unknown function (DUF4145)